MQANKQTMFNNPSHVTVRNATVKNQLQQVSGPKTLQVCDGSPSFGGAGLAQGWFLSTKSKAEVERRMDLNDVDFEARMQELRELKAQVRPVAPKIDKGSPIFGSILSHLGLGGPRKRKERCDSSQSMQRSSKAKKVDDEFSSPSEQPEPVDTEHRMEAEPNEGAQNAADVPANEDIERAVDLVMRSTTDAKTRTVFGIVKHQLQKTWLAIQTPFSQKKREIRVNVNASDTVETVKAKIERQQGIKSTAQRLLLNCKDLNDQCKISELGLEKLNGSLQQEQQKEKSKKKKKSRTYCKCSSNGDCKKCVCKKDKIPCDPKECGCTSANCKNKSKEAKAAESAAKKAEWDKVEAEHKRQLKELKEKKNKKPSDQPQPLPPTVNINRTPSDQPKPTPSDQPQPTPSIQPQPLPPTVNINRTPLSQIKVPAPPQQIASNNSQDARFHPYYYQKKESKWLAELVATPADLRTTVNASNFDEVMVAEKGSIINFACADHLDRNLIIRKIPGDGLCGFRCLATKAWQYEGDVPSDETVMDLNFHLVEKMYENFHELDQPKSVNKDDWRLKKLNPDKMNKDTWCEDLDLLYFSKFSGFSVQIIEYLQRANRKEDEADHTVSIVFLENGEWKAIPDGEAKEFLDKQQSEKPIITLIKSENHFDLVERFDDYCSHEADLDPLAEIEEDDEQPNHTLPDNPPIRSIKPPKPDDSEDEQLDEGVKKDDNKDQPADGLQDEPVVSDYSDSSKDEVDVKNSKKDEPVPADAVKTTSTIPAPERRVCRMLSNEKITKLTEQEVLAKLRTYRYPTVVEEQEKFSKTTPNWRLIVRFLVDNAPFIEFTNLQQGEFNITDKKAFIAAIEEVSEGARKLKHNRINQQLDLSKANLEFFGNGLFQFVRWRELMSQRYIHHTRMSGQCTRFDQNRIRCTRNNNTENGFQQHDSYHDRDHLYICDRLGCHMEFSAFDHQDPNRACNEHKDSHEKDLKKRIKGSTKQDLKFQCDRQNPANQKQCGYSFSEKCNFDLHQREHRRNWKCEEAGCPKTWSAFTTQHPSVALRLHRIKDHHLASVQCSHCESWFEDKSHNGKKFTCEEQRKAHWIDGRCFNFQAPINYIFFHCAPNQSMAESLIAYSGRSDVGLGRPFEQPVALWRNYHKKADDLSKDDKMTKAYKRTVLEGNGLYLMTVHQQPVTDSVSFEEACTVVANSEAATIKLGRRPGQVLCYNRIDGIKNTVDSMPLDQMPAHAQKCLKWMEFNWQKRHYLKFTKKDIDDLLEAFPETAKYEDFFTSNIHRSKENTYRLLEFIKGLNEKHGTNFFRQESPTDDQLNEIKLSDNQRHQKLVEAEDVILDALDGREQDPAEVLKTLRKIWPNIDTWLS